MSMSSWEQEEKFPRPAEKTILTLQVLDLPTHTSFYVNLISLG